MFQTISQTMSEFWTYYKDGAHQFWYNLNPIRYGIMLIMIGVVGWLMMKSGTKRC